MDKSYGAADKHTTNCGMSQVLAVIACLCATESCLVSVTCMTIVSNAFKRCVFGKEGHTSLFHVLSSSNKGKQL